MVAVHAADRVAGTAVVSALGALLHSYRLIESPRWRLRAVVHLAPVLARFRVDVDRLRAELRACALAAICPDELTVHTVGLLEYWIGSGDTGSAQLAAADLGVDALWRRSWKEAGIGAVSASLGLGTTGATPRLQSIVARSVPSIGRVIATGVVPRRGRFVGDLRAARSEEDYGPSLQLFIALADQICERRAGDRVGDAERLRGRLAAVHQAIASAQLARIAWSLGDPRDALNRVRSIRALGMRGGAGLLLVHTALALDQLDHALDIAGTIEPAVLRQRAWLSIALALATTAPRAALRLLARVDDELLAGERRVQHLELVVARGGAHWRRGSVWPCARALAGASAAPAWTELAPRPTVAQRLRVVRLAAAIRDVAIHLDRPGLTNEARVIARDEAARRTLFALVERMGITADGAVASVRAWFDSRIGDAFECEAFVAQATRLARHGDLPAAFQAGLACVKRPPSGDVRSPERALFDEGLALSRDASRRRKVLLHAARYAIRAAVTDPREWRRPVVESRLRCLLHLGGAPSADAITGALAGGDPASPLHARVFATLCALDPARAGALLMTELATAPPPSARLDHAMQLVERHRGLPHGFTRAWADARAAIDRALGEARAASWLAGLISITGGPPELPVLAWIACQPELPDAPSAILGQLERALAGDPAETHAELAARIAASDDLLSLVVAVRPARVAPGLAAWPLSRWRSLVVRAASDAAGEIDRVAIAHFAERIGRASDAAMFLRGDLTALGVPVHLPFEVGTHRFRLRLLDKRADLLTYLRFADLPVDCCYRSDETFYLDPEWDTQLHTIAVWRDPLSFCFHVEREAGGRFVPRGFVFGGFGTTSSGPAAVLNGLYLVNRGPATRIAVLHAIERALAPLRFAHLAIAAEHGGEGPLPSEYKQRTMDVMRWRALHRNGSPVSKSYDDVSLEMNTSVTLEHLWWRS